MRAPSFIIRVADIAVIEKITGMKLVPVPQSPIYNTVTTIMPLPKPVGLAYSLKIKYNEKAGHKNGQL